MTVTHEGMMKKSSLVSFEKALRVVVKGVVSFDDITLEAYATDSSIYQIKPVALVVPQDENDVINAVKTAADHGVSILPRGGATSLGGQATGSSMVIDFTRFMNNVIELNVEERWVRVQPGVILDVLNNELKQHGLMFAPDPATSSRATIGGMMGNNSSGTKSLVYGLMRDHVIESRALLPDGEILDLKTLSPKEYDAIADRGDGSRESELYAEFKKIINAKRKEIIEVFPKTMRRVQGYNLDLFALEDDWNLGNIIIGSEGSLGIFLDAKINLVPLPKEKIISVLHFNTVHDTISAVEPILEYGPSAVELVDSEIIKLARGNRTIAPLCEFIEGDPAAFLVVEFFGDTADETNEKVNHFVSEMKKKGIGYAWPIMVEPKAQAAVWDVRKNGLGILLGMKTERKPIPFIEDCCIPVKNLPTYIDRIITFCTERDINVAFFAHASVGTIHVRPILNLKDRKDIDMLTTIATFALGMVKEYGGAWSGEHGDGRVRSPYLEAFFGEEVYGVLRQVKELFDPRGLMNPGVIIDPDPVDSNLRYGEDYTTPDIPTVYNYLEDGSFAVALEMCNGVGACRQQLSGTMCPSFRLTGEEEHSPRGRANILRMAMSGQLGPDEMVGKRVHEVLDLCLSCKACKTECPSNVDVARLKSEFLSMYREKHGSSLRDRIVALSPFLSSMTAGWKAPIMNAVQKTMLFRKMLEMLAGFDSRRIAPSYASATLNSLMKKRKKGKKTGNKVVLFEDTYMSYHETNVGISAVELLESCGYEVILAKAGCCQRPGISHGFLKEAKRNGGKTLRNLDKYIQDGLKVVVCEPGCFSSLIDDLPDLVGDKELAKRVRANIMMIDAFLLEEINSGRLDCSFTSPFKNVVIHGHCHQKALSGTTAMTEILAKASGVEVEEINSGCCGMAGSFGYEKEHYDESMAIGNDRLFPAIRERAEGAAVVACGFSCRHQIADGTGVKPIHWVETVRGDK